MDDDAESIITNERYLFVGEIIKGCYKKKNKVKMTTSDKIDRVLTHRIWALPIFAVIMFLVYFISVTTVGGWAADWTNDGLFGDGFHLFGIGSSKYEEVSEEYGGADEVLQAYIDFAKDKGSHPVRASTTSSLTAVPSKISTPKRRKRLWLRLSKT